MANGKVPTKKARKIETPTSKRTVQGVSTGADDYDRTVGTMTDYMSKKPKIQYTTKEGTKRELQMLSGMDHYKETGNVQATSGSQGLTLSGKDADDFMMQAYPQIDKKRKEDYASMQKNLGRGLANIGRLLKSDEPSSVIAKKDKKKPE